MLPASLPDLVFMCLAVVLAFGASTALTQSDGDLFAHIQLGLRTIAQLSPPHAGAFGLASQGTAATSPAWLSEVLVAEAWRVGGLPLVTSIAAVIIAAAHATVAWVIRRQADLRWALIGTFVSIALGASHWLARPHMISLLAAALLVAILEQRDARRTFLAVPLMLAWVNLHGAWLFGVVLMGAYVVGDAVDTWWFHTGTARATYTRMAALIATGAVTVVNPYGLALHRDILASLGDPTLHRFIYEHQPPTYDDATSLVFLCALGLSIGLVARSRTPMRTSRLLPVLFTVASALMASRNISLFAVSGWPLIVLHAGEAWPHPTWIGTLTSLSRRESRAMVGSWGAPAAVALLAFGIAGGRLGRLSLINGDVDPRRFPVAALAHVRADGADAVHERIFTPWTWGGYVVFAWPEQHAFIDPLKFSAREVRAYYNIVIARNNWNDELDRWRISTVLAEPGTPLAEALTQSSGWRLTYSDRTALVYRRAIEH